MTETVQVNIYTPDEAMSQGLVSPGCLASTLPTTPARITAWAARRSASGFPVASGFVRSGDSLIPVYDFAATVEWYGNHEPSQEGPPDREQASPTHR